MDPFTSPFTINSLHSLVYCFVGSWVHSVRCARIHHGMLLASPPEFAQSIIRWCTASALQKKHPCSRPLISDRQVIFSKLPLQRPGTTWCGLNFLWTPLPLEIFKDCNSWCDFLIPQRSQLDHSLRPKKLRGSVVGQIMSRRSRANSSKFQWDLWKC